MYIGGADKNGFADVLTPEWLVLPVGKMIATLLACYV